MLLRNFEGKLNSCFSFFSPNMLKKMSQILVDESTIFNSWGHVNFICCSGIIIYYKCPKLQYLNMCQKIILFPTAHALKCIMYLKGV